jgi:ribosomal protein L18E
MKRLAEMDTKVEVLKRRNLDLEKLIEKLKQESEQERSKINEELDIEREKVL